MRVCIVMVLLGYILICSGCRTINSSQSRRVFDERFQERFFLGMSKEAAWTKLKKLRIKPYDHGENDEDIITWINPQRSLIFTGYFDYYWRKRMILYFGDDDALDRVTFQPNGLEDPYEIELFEAEAIQ